MKVTSKKSKKSRSNEVFIRGAFDMSAKPTPNIWPESEGHDREYRTVEHYQMVL